MISSERLLNALREPQVGGKKIIESFNPQAAALPPQHAKLRLPSSAPTTSGLNVAGAPLIRSWTLLAERIEKSKTSSSGNRGQQQWLSQQTWQCAQHCRRFAHDVQHPSAGGSDDPMDPMPCLRCSASSNDHCTAITAPDLLQLLPAPARRTTAS